MKNIKFSHDYEKLPLNWENTQALLIAVYPMKVDILKNKYTSFWRYDTKIKGKDEYYPLNFEDALILIFIHYNSGKLFPTIRRDYPRKREYYQNAIGETFIIEKKG